MKLISKLGLVPPLLAMVLIGGCATVPGGVPLGDLSGLPQTTLPGARLEHARSVAMASARSKGWEIVSAAPNQVILQRELPADAPQAVALGYTPGSPAPRVQVETDMVERRDGTLVALRSFIITDPGTAEARKIDYTESYESELLLSLSSLQSAWLATRDQVTSTVPIPTQAEEETAALDDELTPAEAAFAEGAGEAVADPSLAATPPAAMPPIASAAAAPAPALAPSAVAAPVPAASPAPLPQQSTASAPAAGAALPPAPAPATPAQRNEMLVLNSGARKGLWAYYAEDYARLRGCVLGEQGAVLLQETSAYELHEVHCDGRDNYLLRCQGGVCTPMR